MRRPVDWAAACELPVLYQSPLLQEVVGPAVEQGLGAPARRDESGTVVVTDPRIGRALLLDRRVTAVRPDRRGLISALLRREKAFYDAWPMFAEGEAHRVARERAVAAASEANARLDDATLTHALRSTVTEVAPVGDWGPAVRKLVAGLAGETFGVEGAERAAHMAFLDDVIESIGRVGRGGALLRHRVQRRLVTVERLLETTPAREGIVGVYAQAVQAGRLGTLQSAASLAQVATGLIDPLRASLAALPAVIQAARDADLPAPSTQEALALLSPFRFTSRFALEPLEVGGVPVERGERIVVHLAAMALTAQRSGATPGRLHFGAGPHFCPGAKLVERVIAVATKELAEAGVCAAACTVDPLLFLRVAQAPVTVSGGCSRQG